jgi:hypothetical protein
VRKMKEDHILVGDLTALQFAFLVPLFHKTSNASGVY